MYNSNGIVQPNNFLCRKNVYTSLWQCQPIYWSMNHYCAEGPPPIGLIGGGWVVEGFVCEQEVFVLNPVLYVELLFKGNQPTIAFCCTAALNRHGLILV